MSKSYYGFVKALDGHFLLGGVKTHKSSRFRSPKAAHDWLQTVIETNIHAGRKIERAQIFPSDKAPEIDNPPGDSTRSRTSSRTSTSTKARTTGNVTVTGGAGRGATTTVTLKRNPKKYQRILTPKGFTSGSHRGYSIRSNHMGEYWIEKDGQLIQWVKSVEDGRKVIDDLLGPRQTNPSHFQTLGTAVQIKYDRTTGAHKGAYQHSFTGKNAQIKVGVLNGRKVILIEPGRGTNPHESRVAHSYTAIIKDYDGDTIERKRIIAFDDRDATTKASRGYEGLLSSGAVKITIKKGK